jgi:hypothetical protein
LKDNFLVAVTKEALSTFTETLLLRRMASARPWLSAVTTARAHSLRFSLRAVLPEKPMAMPARVVMMPTTSISSSSVNPRGLIEISLASAGSAGAI